MTVNGASHEINAGTDIKLAIEEAASLLLANQYQGDRFTGAIFFCPIVLRKKLPLN